MYNATIIIGGKQWQASIATTFTELATGLSGAPSLPAGQGMFFDLGSERIVTVNAYEMLFPLSVVFISEDLRVTEVVPLLVPGDDCTSSLPCRYFLELNVGEADDVGPGDSVTIIGYTPTTMNSIISLMVTVLIVAMMMQMMAKAMKGVK